MPCNSDIGAFTADYVAVVFRAVPWAFQGLDEAE